MSNPWKLPATAGPTTVLGTSSVDDLSHKAAPSMQDLMDEALALKLYEEECRAFEKELNPEYFANSSAFGSARDRDDGKEIYGADSFVMEAGEDEEQDDEAEVRAQMAKQLALRAASSSRTSQARQKTQPAAGERKTAKFDRDLAIDDLKGSSKGFNALRESQRKVYKGEKNGLGGGRVEAEQFATIEGVLDERTTRILQKMINGGELDEVHGVVRTGKEAHVYHAVGVEEETLRERELAVKIFKTTLNEFSNRHEYVTGDRRFDLHFQKKDQRRQIKSWTEKEYRNLCRAAKCGIRAPAPLVFKEHVLVMEFIGEGGYPAPTLKDLELTVEQQGHIYADILQATRTLYHVGRLVHGDLSEYNILVYKQRTWLIDFGQAVDRSHPEHETFLKRDLHTLHRFFQRGGLLEASDEEVGLLSDEEAFEYITAESTDELLAEYSPLRELLLLKQDAPAAVEEQEEATEEQAEATGEQEESTASTLEEGDSELKQSGSTDLPKQVEQLASQSAAA